MSQEQHNVLSEVVQKLDLTDKLLSCLKLLLGLIIAGAVWCTSINFRVAQIESDRNQRIPRLDTWRESVTSELSGHEARITATEKLLHLR